MSSASVSADPSPGDHELHRLGEAHHQGQSDGQAVAADDVPAPLECPELGVLRGDPDVGQKRGLQPRGERVAVHRRDDRLEDVHLSRVATLAGRVVEALAKGVVVAELRQIGSVLKVPARTERGLSGARDDQDEGIIVVAEPLPRVV